MIFFFLTVIRHGETTENALNVIQGQLDTELSSNGQAQTFELKKILDAVPYDKIIASDLKRTKYTAEVIAGEAKHKVKLDKRLRERTFGQFNGRPRYELNQFVQDNHGCRADCEGWRAVGAECKHELLSRIRLFFLDLCKEIATESEAVISEVCPFPQYPFHQMVEQTSRIVPNCVPTHTVGRYGGHVILVSHGSWIRHLNQILANPSDSNHTIISGFSTAGQHQSIRNCSICHYRIDLGVESPRESIASIGKSGHRHSHQQKQQCPYAQATAGNLPISSVMCLLFDQTPYELSGSSLNQANYGSTVPSIDQYCLVSNDGARHSPATQKQEENSDDEYAGLPR